MTIMDHNPLNKIEIHKFHADVNLFISLINQQIGGKGKVFCTEEFQLVNVERMMEMEKSPFGNHRCRVWVRQELSVDAKADGGAFRSKRILA